MNTPLLEQLDRHAGDHPDRPAIVRIGPGGQAEHTLSYKALAGAVRAVAGEWTAMMQPGAAVILQLSNGAEYAAAFFGALGAGLRVLPVHPMLTVTEVAGMAEQSCAAVICSDRAAPPGFRALSPDVITRWISEPNPPRVFRGAWRDRPAGELVLQSSGTTGPPKLVVRTAASLDAVARNVVHATSLTERDGVLAAIPLCHSYGIENGLCAPLLAGATLHAVSGFDPNTIATLLATGQITVMPAVPVMIEALAKHAPPIDCGALRLAYSAGASLPVDLARRFAQRVGILPGQLYGATEIGSVLFNDPQDEGFDPQSVGRPMPGVQLKIAHPDADAPHTPPPPGEAGQVWVHAPSMLDRLLNGDAPGIIDGYYPTGDLGTLDAAGALRLTGRLRLLIEVGAMKVNPMEVEAVIASHPSVDLCVVVPARVSATVTRLHAWVTPAPGRTIDPAELRRFARQRLATYKLPRAFQITDQLPRTALGKVHRQALIEQMA